MNRVVLIEDSPEYALALAGNLGEFAPAWRIEIANTMREGLALAAHPTDLLLLDATLPDSDADTSIGWIPTLAIHCPVIVLTAKQIRDTDAFMRCIANGAYEVIEKMSLHRGGVLWLAHIGNTAMAKFQVNL